MYGQRGSHPLEGAVVTIEAQTERFEACLDSEDFSCVPDIISEMQMALYNAAMTDVGQSGETGRAIVSITNTVGEMEKPFLEKLPEEDGAIDAIIGGSRNFLSQIAEKLQIIKDDIPNFVEVQSVVDSDDIQVAYA